MAEGVKPEIKVDAADPTNMADVDEYEDDFALDIPFGQQAWLVKVPKETWAAWRDMYADAADDTPIEIGKMRVYHGKEGEDEDPLKKKVQIRLDATLPQHHDVLPNYELDLKSNGYKNTVVFSEKDLPGHRPSQFGRNRQPPNSRPSGIPAKERYAGGRFRGAIPKQTALAPMIHHEAQANPIEDAYFDAHFTRKWDKSTKPKSQTIFSTGVDRTMHPGKSNLSTFTSFGMSARPGGINRKPVPKEKAVRMEPQALNDAIFASFRRYRYWSLKALRNELKQPETYIKSMLETIATLIRSGDFAMTYQLKPEYAMMGAGGEEGMVESGLDTDMGGDDEMDDDGEGAYEDVKMEGAAGP